jgi:hypothetical protein
MSASTRGSCSVLRQWFALLRGYPYRSWICARQVSLQLEIQAQPGPGAPPVKTRSGSVPEWVLVALFLFACASALAQSGNVAETRSAEQASPSSGPYARTPQEVAAAVAPSNYQYEPGNILRYGADPTGASSSDRAMEQALRAGSAVYIPRGSYLSAKQVLVPNGATIYGLDRNGTVWEQSGVDTSAFRNVNGPNSSGYGRVNFFGFKIVTKNPAHTGAAIELNAGGYAFYEIHDMWIMGAFRYGVILDGAEVVHIERNIIENANPGRSDTANIWVVNGPDRTRGQVAGFTNSVTINNNQLNAAAWNILDDGGSNHALTNNNCNGATRVPIQVAALQSFVIENNEIEQTRAIASGPASIYFFDQTGIGGATVGACEAGRVAGNTLAADVTSGRDMLFAAHNSATYHRGLLVQGNWGRNNKGRAASYDLTQLGNSWVGPNFDSAARGPLYMGSHLDANGNVMFPAQNGFAGDFSEGAYVLGDTRYPLKTAGGLVVGANGSPITTKLKGTSVMSDSTRVAVSFAIRLPSANYQVAMSADAPGGPFWVSGKTASGFTINSGSRYRGSIDWILEQ